MDVRAFAPGFPDMLMVQGGYQLKPPLPFTPCTEFSGIISAIGADIAGLKVGDAVMGSIRYGAASEQVTARASDCMPKPAAFGFDEAAAFLVAYKTAYVGLIVRGTLKAGETALIHGAAGGVGLAAVEIAKREGAQVIAMASGKHKLEILESRGADQVLDYSVGRFRETIKALTDGAGADVIYDPIGGDVFDESTRCIAPFGRLLVIGFAGGRIPTVAANHALIKQYAVIGVRAGEYGRINPGGGTAVNRALSEMAIAGQVSPYVYASYRFDQLKDAFDTIKSREVVGRVVVVL